MSGKYALIIANTKYSNPGLAQLTAPGKDAEDLARILRDPDICGFDEVRTVLNEPEHIVRNAIDAFMDGKSPHDLLLLYFSGHGIRDERGALYLAVKNTDLKLMRSTAIKSDFIREAMDQSRSRRQVLILDCCNSGAFAQGTKSAVSASVGTASAFEGGYGRIILTASDSTQFAWEGDKIIGETQNSLFTHFLVKGLLGEADRDGNGQITADELYDYAYEQVKLATPEQTPSKFSSKQQGEIVLRSNIRIKDVKPMPLPDQLLGALENPFSDIRLGAVHQLAKLMNGKNLGMARSAMEILERISKEDDSRAVSQAASKAMETWRGKAGSGPIPPIVVVPVAPVNTASLKTKIWWETMLLEKSKKVIDFLKSRRPAIQTLLAVLAGVAMISVLAFASKVIVVDPPPDSTSFRIEKILLSKSDKDRSPTFFFESGQDVYVHLYLNYVPTGTNFKTKWYYRLGTLGNNIYILTTTYQYSLQLEDKNILFYITDTFLKGNYRIDVYMDENLVGVKYFSVK